MELAALEALDFEWLRDSTLRSVLRDLETYCGIELAYDQNLRMVQLNLNEVPHGTLAGHDSIRPGCEIAGKRREASRTLVAPFFFIAAATRRKDDRPSERLSLAGAGR